MASLNPYIAFLGDYNKFANAALYEAANTLPPERLTEDMGGAYRSILGVFNHLLVADIIWLKRFDTLTGESAVLNPVVSMQIPASLSEIMFDALPALWDARGLVDETVVAWAHTLLEDDFDRILRYTDLRGNTHRKNYGRTVLHFFNHQTHHRGQASALLRQAGAELKTFDLFLLIPEESSDA